jgi:hypothetical protein
MIKKLLNLLRPRKMIHNKLLQLNQRKMSQSQQLLKKLKRMNQNLPKPRRRKINLLPQLRPKKKSQKQLLLKTNHLKINRKKRRNKLNKKRKS